MPTVVQSKAVINTSGVIAFTSNVVAGNLLVAVFGDEASLATATVTDTTGSTWASAVNVVNGGGSSVNIFYAIAAGSGACTVTLGSHSPTIFCNAAIFEASAALSTLDGTPVGAANSSGAPGSITTSFASSLVVAGFAGFHSSNVWTPPGGWTMTQQNGQDSVGVAWIVQVSPATVTPTFSGTNASGNSGAIAAFKAGSAGASALMINPGMDGGMTPQMKGGINA